MIKKYIKDIKGLIFFTGCIVVNVQNVAAQKTDTISLLKDFVNISNGYKQMPLYLKLEMKNTTNFITGEEDTSDLTGEFFLRSDGSYIRFGEFEQVVNDSLALLVSDRLQRMILYTNAGPVVKKMKAMMGLVMPDSSLRNLAGKFRSASTRLSNESSLIELRSRIVLYGTNLPKETIELQYNTSTRLPQQVVTLKRNLLRLDSVQYSRLQNEPVIAEKLFTLEGSYFLVKEQVTAYLYKQINQASAAVKVPVLISDRIIKTDNGEYKPVKTYESYLLTKSE